MRAVVVANHGDGDDGFVGERLAEVGFQFDRLWREAPEHLAGAEEGADLLVLLGSDWSVYTERNAAEVGAELELCRRARERGVPVLGICFGGQLVAASLGWRIARAEVPEIGWRTLHSEEPALCGDGPWFEYHFDRWHERGVTRSFIVNEAAPQGFVIGRTLALQFHPEVTPATVSQWLRAAPEEVAATGGVIEEIEAESVRLAPDARARCRALVDTFLAEIAAASTLDDGPAGA